MPIAYEYHRYDGMTNRTPNQGMLTYIPEYNAMIYLSDQSYRTDNFTPRLINDSNLEDEIKSLIENIPSGTVRIRDTQIHISGIVKKDLPKDDLDVLISQMKAFEHALKDVDSYSKIIIAASKELFS